MPTVAFSTIEQVYGDWGPKNQQQAQKTQQNNNRQNNSESNNLSHDSLVTNLNNFSAEELGINPWIVNGNVNNEQSYGNSEKQHVYGLKSFCPNCHDVIRANNILQQKIVEQNIWPRPRWIPQNPGAYEQWDPYNRYFSQNQFSERLPPWSRENNYNNHKEYFSQSSNNPMLLTNTDQIVQLILIVIVVLFVLQLIELLISGIGKLQAK
jgi:hypothetical protein